MDTTGEGRRAHLICECTWRSLSLIHMPIYVHLCLLFLLPLVSSPVQVHRWFSISTGRALSSAEALASLAPPFSRLSSCFRHSGVQLQKQSSLISPKRTPVTDYSSNGCLALDLYSMFLVLPITVFLEVEEGDRGKGRARLVVIMKNQNELPYAYILLSVSSAQLT